MTIRQQFQWLDTISEDQALTLIYRNGGVYEYEDVTNILLARINGC